MRIRCSVRLYGYCEASESGTSRIIKDSAPLFLLSETGVSNCFIPELGGFFVLQSLNRLVVMTCHISGSMTRHTLYILLVNPSIIHSRDKERRVYFDAKAKIHLKEYLASRTDENPALFVTLDAPHSRLKISGVEIRLRTLGRELSLERIHPHKFRRTMATRAIDKGMPIEQVQKILGHSQIDTTMQYVVVNQDSVKSSHRKYIA